jgi:putative nucleotidyltransferase with HDIG domain
MVTKYREIDEPDTPVQVDKLIVGMRLPFDVFIKDKGLTKQLFSKGMLYTNITRDLLKERGISEIYIKMKEVPLLERYLPQTKTHKTSFYDDPAVFKEYSYHKEQYYQIDRNILVPGTMINFSLFTLDKLVFSPIVEATEKSPVKIDENILNASGDIAIKKSDVQLYNAYLDSLLKDSTSRQDSLKVKAAVIRENSKIIIKDFLDNPRSGEKIKEVKSMVDNTIDCILKNKDAIYDLLSLKGYDYYTYTHSVNVAIMSIGLGMAIDLKTDDVEKLGIGAMLHDVGKSAIPYEILNKQGKLDDIEYKVLRNHVIEGEKILRTHKEMPDESFAAVIQHHEKLTGKGYPFQLSGNNIKLFGRITAIADCYDALTTQRPYKPAFSPFYALSIVAKETGDYDPDLLKTFIKMLGKIK